VQDALAWTGHFNLLHDGAVGARTLAAISAFQRQQGWPVTGSLDAAQTMRLLEIAQVVRTRAGFQEITDRRAHITIGVPTALVSYHSATPNGSRYRSRDGQLEVRLVRYEARERPLRTLYDQVRAQHASADRRLDRLFSDRFFYSVATERRVFYYSARHVGSDVKAFTFSYPPEVEEVVGPIIIAMGNSFKAPMIDYTAVARAIRDQPFLKSPQVAGCEQRAGHQYYRVTDSVPGGLLNLRSGPGIHHSIVAVMPAGSCGIRRLGQCEFVHGAASQWCHVEWSGISGWASMSGLIADYASTAAPAQVAAGMASPFVARGQLIPVVSSLMSDAGLTAYRFLPPSSTDDNGLAWAFEDGSVGELVALRPGAGMRLEEVSNGAIRREAGSCKGTFVTMRRPPRYFQGSEVQKVEAVCREGDALRRATYSIIELPSGAILRFASKGVFATERPPPEEREIRLENAAVTYAASRADAFR
jgi:peptidoglycan hydrolase-like protein with peptidoglycan-binding domain